MTTPTCPHCGANMRPGAVFCAVCGRPLIANQPATPGGNSPRLIIQEPGQAARTVSLTRPQITLGRAPDNEIQLNHPAVSGHHARLDQRGGDYWLIDLNSTNGTFVNGQRVQSQVLKEGDIIRIGDVQGNSVGLTFRQGADSRPSTIYLGQLNLAQWPTFTIGRDPANQIHLDHPLVSRRHAQVERVGPSHHLRDLNSSNGTFVNGQPVRGVRQLQPRDVVQIGPFKLVYDQAGFAQYAPGGNYRLDGLKLWRPGNPPGLGQRLKQQLSNRKGYVGPKIILNNVSLSIEPRAFVALVGGSGAGKSTLMKALSGFEPAQQGRVLLNGDDLYANFAAYRHILGYVPQDDIIHQHLTVRGALNYAARLRLPDAGGREIAQRVDQALKEVELVEHAGKMVKQLSGGQRKRVSIAVELLAEPGLFFLDEPTSGLDPGLEKKMMRNMRLLADGGRTIVLVTHATANIAQCTHVAFMAEGYLAYFGPPHEALTFFQAKDFADIYTRLTQPLDPVENPLPAPYQCYQQQVRAAQPQPPPQSIAETAAVWAAAFQDSPQYRQYVAGRLQAAVPGGPAPASPPQRRATPSLTAQLLAGLKQFGVLTQRYFELIRRDAVSLFILLAVMPLIGLLLLIMANPDDLVGKESAVIETEIQDKIAEKRAAEDSNRDDEQFQETYEVASSAQKVLFMLALAANLLGIFASAYEIVKEEAIYRRERMVNLQIVPYLFSKITVLAVFALLQCFLLLLVIGLRVRYPTWGVFLPTMVELYLTLFLATLASLSLGLLISALVRSSGTVIYIILLVLFIQIIFAGAIFELPTLAQPISFLTTTRWTLEALGSSVDLEDLKAQGVTCVEFEDDRMQTLLDQRAPEAPCREKQMKQSPDYPFNVSYKHSVGHLALRWLALAGFAGVFGVLTVIIQKRKDVV